MLFSYALSSSCTPQQLRSLCYSTVRLSNADVVSTEVLQDAITPSTITSYDTIPITPIIPEIYQFLTMDIKTYQQYIMSEFNWGGALEILILAYAYHITIHVLDISNGIIQTFNKHEQQQQQQQPSIYLAYSGTHYDTLVISTDIYDTEHEQVNKTDVSVCMYVCM